MHPINFAIHKVRFQVENCEICWLQLQRFTLVTSSLVNKRDENPNLRQDFSWCPLIMNYELNKKQGSSEERMQENNKNTSIRCGLGCQNAKLKYVYVMVNKAIYPFSFI